MKPLKYREAIKKLQKHDKRFEILKNRGKGSEQMLYHPDVDGEAKSYPLKHHGDGTEIKKGHLSAIIRRFDLPKGFFD